MYEYSVIVPQKTSLSYLSYYFASDLLVGQVCHVEVRNNQMLGLIVNKTQIDENNINLKIKNIIKVFPFIISDKQISYLKNISFNSFNNYDAVWNAMSKPFENLSQKDVALLDNFNNSSENSKNDSKNSDFETLENEIKIDKKTPNSFSLKYELYTDVTLRIMDIIRTDVCNIGNTKTVLIFPEQKLLDKVLNQIMDNNEFGNLLKENNQEILIYNGKKTKSNNQTVLKLITENKNQIIFGSRSALFLPYPSLDQLVIVDESNSFHIQEQGGFYYDSREIAYLLGYNYLTSLLFISKVPSIRLHRMQPGGFLDTSLNTNSYYDIKLPTIKVINDDSSRYDKSVISEGIENYLSRLIENEGESYFYSEEV